MRNENHAQSGFTLIEMLIVTTVIGVVAGMTVPNLLSSRLAANEAAVIATLRAISTAQFQFQSAGELDQNDDAGFEYGTLGELGALDPLRGGAAPIARNLLSSRVATVDANGWMTHHGYHFCLYLPDAAGAGVPGTPANAADIDPVMARNYWVCVAWPVQEATTGNCTFFVNQQGQVMRSRKAGYTGATSVPPAGAALLATASDANIDSQALATDQLGMDGKLWTVVH